MPYLYHFIGNLNHFPHYFQKLSDKLSLARILL